MVKHVILYTGVATQRRDARRELQRMAQRPNEKMKEYYHRIPKIGFHLPTCSHHPHTHSHTHSSHIHPLFEKEKKRKEKQKREKKAPIFLSRHRSSVRALLDVQALLDDARAVGSITRDVRHKSTMNSRFGTIARKPEGWDGSWYNPQAVPKKLDNTERQLLTGQGRTHTLANPEDEAEDEAAVIVDMYAKRGQ